LNYPLAATGVTPSRPGAASPDRRKRRKVRRRPNPRPTRVRCGLL